MGRTHIKNLFLEVIISFKKPIKPDQIFIKVSLIPTPEKEEKPEQATEEPYTKPWIKTS